ncbi:hypothetical protein BKK49_01310 [Rodentibacter rarus]|uniref:hypothetical protein n=1 Tax=Rodentibacter rarus TaxID=1908260 RepID=UPI000985A835|nr:hypothetical protein [Rodentibacter rarus]OOF42992.1 hypothetical protein BKK49_01310 [Rodentibacter rarus]
MENSKKESSTPRKDLGLLKEDAKKLSITNNKCEQPGVRKVLSKDFGRYTKLVSDSYHKFDVPRQAIIEQLSELKRHEPLRVLLTELMPDLLKKLNLEPENTAGLDRTSYVFCRTVADICIGFENTPEGEKELETLFTAPEASNGAISGDQYRKSIKEAFDAIFGTIESITDFSHRTNKLIHVMRVFFLLPSLPLRTCKNGRNSKMKRA